MKRVFMLSRFAPPMFSIGGKRAWRFARYLPQHGWEPVLITSPTPAEGVDETAGLPLPPEASLVREYLPSIVAKRKNKKASAKGSASKKPSKGLGSDGSVAAPVSDEKSLKDRIGRVVRSPVDDELWLWPHFERNATDWVQRFGRPSCVWASSAPRSALVFGARLAKRYGVPFIADLRDPWTLSFLQEDKAAWVRAADRTIEHRLFKGAARVVFTAERCTDAYRNAYPTLPADRFTTILNAFDPEQRPKARTGLREGASKALELVHFGNVYGTRSMAPILKAIAEAKEGKSGREVRLLNLGRVSEADLALAQELGVRDQLHYQTAMGYADGLSLLSGASLALLLGYGESELFVPGKLYDYMLARVPVLEVGPKAQATELLEEAGLGTNIAAEDTSAIANYLRTYKRPEDFAPDVDRYGADRTAAELAEVFDAALWARGR